MKPCLPNFWVDRAFFLSDNNIIRFVMGCDITAHKGMKRRNGYPRIYSIDRFVTLRERER